MNKPEILAPAGDLEKLKTAFMYGADACYMGMPSLSMRVRENEMNKDDLEESLKRVLESALVIGASSARVYLLPSIIPNSTEDASSSFRLGSGPGSDTYKFLDVQVAGLTEQQEVLKLNNLKESFSMNLLINLCLQYLFLENL